MVKYVSLNAFQRENVSPFGVMCLEIAKSSPRKLRLKKPRFSRFRFQYWPRKSALFQLLLKEPDFLSLNFRLSESSRSKIKLRLHDSCSDREHSESVPNSQCLWKKFCLWKSRKRNQVKNSASPVRLIAAVCDSLNEPRCVGAGTDD